MWSIQKNERTSCLDKISAIWHASPKDIGSQAVRHLASSAQKMSEPSHLTWLCCMLEHRHKHFFQQISTTGVCVYMSPVPGPPHPPLPPQWYPPPTPNPPTPQNLVFACYLHIYIHIYTYILPFPPFHPRISTLFAALESEPRPRQRTLSTCIFLS